MMYFNKDFSLITGYRFLLKGVIDFIASLDKYSPNKKAKLLDIGCGMKPYEKLFSNYKYLGLDQFPDVSKPDIIGSITKIPMKENSVEACMTVWVLDDLPEPEKGIKEISRVLKNRGYYFAIECQATNQHFKPHDYFRFAPNAMISMCKKHNLKIVKYKSFGGNFALSGFILIVSLRRFFGFLRLESYASPLYCLLINIIFYPLDRMARKLFKEKFEDYSIGYTYIFQKIKND